MSTIIRTEYKSFVEHTPDVQARIIEKNRNFNTEDSYWYESTIDDFKEAAFLIGIDIKDIFFQLGYVQSDYAGFTGYYSYKKGALNVVKTTYPQWTELHQLAAQLQREQCRTFYSARVHISMRRDCMQFETYQDKGDERASVDIEQLLRDFTSMIYISLRKEYQTSDESLIEYFTNTTYEFNEKGDLL